MSALSPATVLQTLLAVSRDGVIVFDRAGRITCWNRAATLLFGVAEAAAIGLPVAQFVPEGPALMRAAGADAVAEPVQTTGVNGAGQHVPLILTLTAMLEPDARGEPGAGLLTVRAANDAASCATDRRQASDLNSERMNLLLAASGMGDWSWDARTDQVILSARAAEIFDLPADSVITWSALRELLHPDDRERARVAVESAVADKHDYALDYRLINGGVERWVSARGRCLYDQDGLAVSMLGVIQEITNDRLLLQVDDAVRSLIEPADITYTAASVLGQHLRVNRCAYAFVEDDQDTFILTGNFTHGVHSIVGTYRFRQFGEECLRLMRAGLPWVVADSADDPRIDSADRQSYELTAIRSVICVPITKAGRFVAAMAVHAQVPRSWLLSEVQLVQQVASRCWESIERARVERDRVGLLTAAQAANRAKDEFMAMLGHELRNPLAPMFTALHLMKMKGDTGFERERAVIERQVTHLARLVDDLLDVSRIARGIVELKMETVELAEVVRRAVDVADPLLEQRRHTLALQVPPHGGLVRADVTRLVQVVSNLLNNAAKYTPPAGRIEVFTSVSDSEICLHVRDSGVGMSAQELNQAFDMFVQGRQAIDRAHGGLGLGLTIVRSLVERHGGTVSAASAGPGQGSEFVVRLPRAEESSTADVVATGLPASAGLLRAKGARVLVVDDNEDGALMLARVLTACGCDVQVAHDGLQALELGAAAEGFDAALLDIGLPVMDGYELAARLRELPSLRRAWLVAVTGYGQPSDRQRALAAGFEEHLVKPLDREVLETIIATISSRRV